MALKIMVVEDDEASQYIYRTLLTNMGYVVEIHGDAEGALAAAQQSAPALVITDIGLPGMDGIEFTRLLRRDPATAHVPVMVLTVYAFDADRERALSSGATRFMTKPVDWDQVMAVVVQTAGPAHAQ